MMHVRGLPKVTQAPCEFCGDAVRWGVPLRRVNRAGRSANFCLSCLNAVDEGWINFPGGEGATFDPWMVGANRDPISGGWKVRP